MKIRRFIYMFMAIPLSLSGQVKPYDTIPAGTPIPDTKGLYILENTVDTAITIVINELMASNDAYLHDEYGDDDDWFEIYNYGDEPIWMGNLWFTDNYSEPFKWKSAVHKYLEPEQFYIFWADNETEEGDNHCPFKLSSDGEFLGISYKDSSIIDQLLFPPQETNISYGRYPNGADSWGYFDEPSPNDFNENIGGNKLLPLPISSSPGGICKTPKLINLTSPEENAIIRYTIDCNDPTPESPIFENKIYIPETRIIKARLFKEGSIPGPILTLSFLFIDYSLDNPIISLVANDEDFYGSAGLISANNTNIEVSANMEFIENGKSTFSSGTGIQLHTTKSYKPRSFRLYARSRYGNSWFEQAFFKEKGPKEFKRIILRNSGNDNLNRSTENTHFRDPLIHTIAEKNNPNSNISQSRPVNVFLNGNYYGMLNMRERIDEHYINSHKGFSENFNLIERCFNSPGNRNTIFGEYAPYGEMVSQIDTLYDISTDEGFQFVKNNINIDNFTDYWITEVFAGNFDWLSNNVKFWRPSEGGRWEWIYWDLDHGLGLPFSSYGNVEWNTLEWSLSNLDRTWAGYNNRIIRNLLMNEEYEEYFIKRFSAYLNSGLSPENTIPILDSMQSLYTNDIVIHANAWSRDIDKWSTACQTVKSYLQNRPGYQFNHIQEYFNLQDPVNVTIKLLPEGCGSIIIEDINSHKDEINGRFFPGINYYLKVQLSPGYSVSDWSIPSIDQESAIVDFTENQTINIHCIQVSLDTLFEISEIYYHNKENYDCQDWIEIYYNGSNSIDISGFYIKNEAGETIATVNEQEIVKPNSYFIISKNKYLFDKVYPQNLACVGGLTEELSSNEKYELYSKTNLKILSFTFMEDTEGWPLLSNEGYSIERIHLQNNPMLGSSWMRSRNKYGSPGLASGSQYNYHAPSGITKEFENIEVKDLSLLSDPQFYNDPDGHEMAGIYIKSITGPGKIYRGNSLIEAYKTYAPSDFLFTPGGTSSDSTILTYNFIDFSGDISSDQRIIYRAPNNIANIKSGILNIYPNPSSGLCSIEFPKGCMDDLQLTIVGFGGAILFQQNIGQSEKTEIDLSELKNGMYIIHVKGENSLFSGKIIINK